jgi:hypothetical protein
MGNQPTSTNGNGRQLTLGISEKGAIMVLGLRKFPVTFYADEWRLLAGLAPHIERYAVKHQSQLKTRADNPKAARQGQEVVTI